MSGRCASRARRDTARPEWTPSPPFGIESLAYTAPQTAKEHGYGSPWLLVEGEGGRGAGKSLPLLHYPLLTLRYFRPNTPAILATCMWLAMSVLGQRESIRSSPQERLTLSSPVAICGVGADPPAHFRTAIRTGSRPACCETLIPLRAEWLGGGGVLHSFTARRRRTCRALSFSHVDARSAAPPSSVAHVMYTSERVRAEIVRMWRCWPVSSAATVGEGQSRPARRL